jgi:hypothetical protein
MEARIETNAGGIRQNTQDVESLRQELRRVMSRMDDEREARETALCEELRDRELRRLNLIMHGLHEPAQSISDNRDRAEADRRMCSEVLSVIGVRTRGQDLKFCRRIGERGRDPRPLVMGIRTEEERRNILDRSRALQSTRFENVAIVPDLTRMQRRAEDQLSKEAEQRNQSLTVEDRERNLRWLVIGRRGEKRLIKGTEQPPQRDRGQMRLGDFLTGANETALGARRREFPPLPPPAQNAPHIPPPRLLDPLEQNRELYRPQQHRPVQSQNGGGGGFNGGNSNFSNGGQNFSQRGGNGNGGNNGYGNQTSYNNTSGGNGGNSSGNGNGGNNGYGNRDVYNNASSFRQGNRTHTGNGNAYGNNYRNGQGGGNYNSYGNNGNYNGRGNGGGDNGFNYNGGGGNGVGYGGGGVGGGGDSRGFGNGNTYDNNIDGAHGGVGYGGGNNGNNGLDTPNLENWSQSVTDRPDTQPITTNTATLGRPRLGSKRGRNGTSGSDTDQRPEEGPPRTRQRQQQL